jgi:putative ABC transport system permease protein
MAQAVYQQYWQDDRVRSAAIFFQPDTDISSASAALQADLGHWQPLRVTNRADIRALSLDIFDRTFAITRVLYWLILGVAGIGLLSALLALQLEQQRPFAILRAVGFTAWETASLSIQRTAIMGGLAGLLAIPTGLLMGLILIEVINRRAFGWTMQITLDVANLAQTVLLAVLVAIIAGAYPAWLLLRALPAERLREE